MPKGAGQLGKKHPQHSRIRVVGSWASRNKERRNASSKARREIDPEISRAYVQKWRKNNLAYDAMRQRERNAVKRNAVPLWIDRDLVKDMYEEGRYFQMDIDHIVPLRHPLVCGLHWEGNLQLLSQKENRAKGNRHWPDMP